MAEGKSILSGIEYIERGYENLENKLTKLGAKIYKQ
jgi:UDP-N-acetylglucosamine 1-carboxyvinyltransferase